MKILKVFIDALTIRKEEQRMKKVLLSVKTNNKDEFWCEAHGNALEIMAGNLVILENTIRDFKEYSHRGETLLKMLLEDIEDLFNEYDIRIDKGEGNENKEND